MFMKLLVFFVLLISSNCLEWDKRVLRMFEEFRQQRQTCVLWIENPPQHDERLGSVVNRDDIGVGVQFVHHLSHHRETDLDETCHVHVWGNLEDFVSFVDSHRQLWSTHAHQAFTTFILVHDVNVEVVGEMLAAIPLLLNSRVFILEVHENESYAITEAYSSSTVHNDNGLITKRVCEGTTRSGICDFEENLWHRRKDLSQVHVKAAIENATPFTMVDKHKNMRGIFPSIFMEMRKFLNFSFSIHRSVDGSWGKRQSGGHFSGMVGMLQRREIDMMMSVALPNQGRSEVISATTTIIKNGYRMFTQTSLQEELSTYELFQVFYKDVWYVLAMTLVGIVLMFTVMFMLEAESWTFHSLCLAFAHSVALTYRMMILRGYDMLPKFLSGKIALLAASVLSVIIFAYIRAGVLSKLAVKRPSVQIRSLQDVLSSDYEIGTTQGGSLQAFFEAAPVTSVQHRLWTKKMKPNYDSVMQKTTDDGLKAIASRPKYIFFLFNSMGLSSSLFPCQIRAVGPLLGTMNVAMGLQKESPLLPLFNYCLRKLRENGVLDRIIEKWSSREEYEADCVLSDDNGLGFGPVFGLFALLLLGMGASFLFFLIEMTKFSFGSREQDRLLYDAEDFRKRHFRDIMMIIQRLELTNEERMFLISEMQKQLSTGKV